MSPMMRSARLVMALCGTVILDHNSPSGNSSNRLADGVRDVRLGGDSFKAMSDAPMVMPCPVCADESVEGLMFPTPLMMACLAASLSQH